MADKGDPKVNGASGSAKGKKNKKKAAAEASADPCCSAGACGGTVANKGPEQNLDPGQLAQIKKAMEMLQLQQEKDNSAKTSEDAKKKAFKFWNTQPVPKIDEEVTTNEAISPNVPHENLRHEPFTLPNDFHWVTLNIDDPLELKELYILLNENYVEDDDNMFRFDYSPGFLHWALQPPGYLREWHTGVRSTKSKKLVGFISAVPANIRTYDKQTPMVEINFLCVHKKLRSKRLAPVLIKEITRRVNCQGLFQAVYTAGIVLPKPVGTCRYWHRSLNPKKLIEVKFSHLSRNMTMQRHLKLYRLPDETKVSGMRQLKSADVPEACKLLNEFLGNYDLSPTFTDEDFTHWFLPRDNIVESYVVESASGKLTDFVSFYSLPSTIMSHPTYNKLNAAYSFYNVSTVTPWVELMGDALILAKKRNFDVFNALDLMENGKFLEKLKFGIGDGNLQYYLYNWRCPNMNPNRIGLVLQ